MPGNRGNSIHLNFNGIFQFIELKKEAVSATLGVAYCYDREDEEFIAVCMPELRVQSSG